jgi:hypothetical protein
MKSEGGGGSRIYFLGFESLLKGRLSLSFSSEALDDVVLLFFSLISWLKSRKLFSMFYQNYAFFPVSFASLDYSSQDQGLLQALSVLMA